MESRNWVYTSHDSMAAAELSHRINCWRQNVEVCDTLDSTSPSLQYPFPCEGLPPSLQTRPRNLRRRKPYTRPPDSPRQQRPPQMDVSDLHDAQSMSLLDPRQVRGAVDVAKRVGDDNCGMSGLTTSFKESAGLQLPHPERNPLIAYHPDVLKEEYCRLALLFARLRAECSKEEYRWLQTSSKDAMANVMHLGSNIQRVASAAQYVVQYSQFHGWEIDFVALAYGAQVAQPAAKVMPSRVRELVCSPDISNNRDSSAEWHLYPAA